MAILTKTKIPGGHWYTGDGLPAHRQMTSDGSGERATTLRDARKLHLYPSVTSILGILAKPGLENWKQDQCTLAAVANPKQADESDQYYCKRIRDMAFEQVEQAADLGTSIHAALESAMAGDPYQDDLDVYVRPVMDWKEESGIVFVEREIILVNHDHGFAGTADVFFRYGKNGIGILDYKTRKTQPGVACTPYDGQAMQLAAYAATYWGEDNLHRVVGANVYISTTEPGRVEVYKHLDKDNKPDLTRHWEAFKSACDLWRYFKGYDPRTAE